MAKEKKDKHFIHRPEYVGGPKAMQLFVRQHLRYPADALAQQVHGIVVVGYDIDHQGNVVDTRVISGLGHGCDEEAMRVVRLLKFKVPKSRGVHVVYHQKLNIGFHLPSAAATVPSEPAPASVQYSYTSTAAAPKDKESTPKPAPKTYTYTVNL